MVFTFTKEHEKHEELLGHEDETLLVRPPWRQPHHFWLRHHEKKKRERGKNTRTIWLLLCKILRLLRYACKCTYSNI